MRIKRKKIDDYVNQIKNHFKDKDFDIKTSRREVAIYLKEVVNLIPVFILNIRYGFIFAILDSQGKIISSQFAEDVDNLILMGESFFAIDEVFASINMKEKIDLLLARVSRRPNNVAVSAENDYAEIFWRWNDIELLFIVDHDLMHIEVYDFRKDKFIFETTFIGDEEAINLINFYNEYMERRV